ncbi:MAG: cupin domain-containing protein [Terricaulis silvestris]
MKKIDIEKAPARTGSRYPAPHDAVCKARSSKLLGDAAGLTQFGVNLVRIPPGSWSSQRHWHEKEDEFVWVVEGELVLVTDSGEEVFRAGDCAGFKASVHDGHCFQNRSDKDALILAIGTRSDEDWGEYSDIDMKFWGARYSGKGEYTRKNGDPI